MKNNIFWGCFVVFIFTIIGSTDAYGETVSQTVSNLEEPTWVFKSGMSRAKNHDRQDLGIVLNEGSTIKIRKKNTEDGYKNLTFWLLGKNRKEEKSVTITTDWQTIQISHSGVPFINTPYGQKKSEIEYEVQGSYTRLPIYNHSEDEEVFFSEWDTENAPFALVKGSKFQLLIPYAEKDKTKNLRDFTNLNDYIDYQDSIIRYYDDFMGLSDATASVHKIPENRFFLKADGGVSAGVAAYYGSNYSANGEPTVVNMWMEKWNWATLHELGHAYQPAYNNKGMYTGEVSNNLLAVYFTYEQRGKLESDKKSWLFNYGKKESVEASLYDQLINKKIGYPEIDHRRRLILLTSLAQSAGKENWIKLNKEYRESANSNNGPLKNMSLPDLFNYFYSKETGKDYSPVFAKWGLSLNETRQQVVNRWNGLYTMASLVDVVPKERLKEAVASLSDTLLVDSQFSLVTNQELKSLNLSGGSLTLHLKIDDFNQIKGQKLLLKEGKQVVKEVEINSPDIVIPELENGVYHIEFPQLKERYKIDNYYVHVRDSQNEATITMEQLTRSNLFNETIYFKGLSDSTFGVLKTDFVTQKITFSATSATPHSYYSGELYASVEILDELGNSIYKKEMEGTKVQLEEVELPLKEGYQIKIYHAETKGRLVAGNVNLINKTDKTNVLLVKNGYLVNQKKDANLEIVKETIVKKIEELSKDQELSSVPSSTEKDQIALAIFSLPNEEQEQLLEKYQDFLGIYPGEISIHYVDESGQVVKEPNIYNGRFGEVLKVQAKEVDNYDLLSEHNILEMKYLVLPQESKFVYKKKVTTAPSTSDSSESTSETSTSTTSSSESTSETSTSTKPSTESTSETSTSTKPSVESTSETSTSTKPSSESTSETSTSTKPSIESTSETSTSTKPSTESTSETSTSTKPSTESTNETSISTKPSTESTNETSISTKPSTESTNETSTSTKPSSESTSETSTSTKPSTESTSETSTSTKPSTESTNETSTNTKPSTESTSETSISESIEEPNSSFNGKIELREVAIAQGEQWNPANHFKTLVIENKSYSFEEAIKSSILSYSPNTLDTSKPGIYTITFTIDKTKIGTQSNKRLASSKTEKTKQVLSVETKVHVIASGVELSKELPTETTTLGKNSHELFSTNPKRNILPQTGAKQTNPMFVILGLSLLSLSVGIYLSKKKIMTTKRK